MPDASLLIRKLDSRLKQRLRVRAAGHGRSMEEEAREILRAALAAESKPGSLIRSIRQRFKAAGYVDLGLPDRKREPVRPPPDFR